MPVSVCGAGSALENCALCRTRALLSAAHAPRSPPHMRGLREKEKCSGMCFIVSEGFTGRGRWGVEGVDAATAAEGAATAGWSRTLFADGCRTSMQIRDCNARTIPRETSGLTGAGDGVEQTMGAAGCCGTPRGGLGVKQMGRDDPATDVWCTGTRGRLGGAVESDWSCDRMAAKLGPDVLEDSEEDGAGGGRQPIGARRAPIEVAGLRFRRPPAVVVVALRLLVEPSSRGASRLAQRMPASAYGCAMLSGHPKQGGAEGMLYLSFAPRRGACLVVQSQLAEYGQLKPRLIRAGREVAVPQKLGVAGHAAGDWRPGSIGHPLLHHVHRALLGLYKVDHGNRNRSPFMWRTSEHFL